MKEVLETKKPDVAYYATHHGVHRPEKLTTKLRVVFNCSSKTSNGLSLNSIQYNGGVIQDELFSLMIRFRKHIYALTADIKMMYRTILIHPDQHCLQRILWKDSINELPKTYELTRLTYGTVCAPNLAMRTLKQLSIDTESSFPVAASVLRNDFYMDDVLCGDQTLSEAKQLQHELITALKSAGMEMHKWCANHSELAPTPEGNYNFGDSNETKTLGVLWNSTKNCFTFKVTVDLNQSYTKRTVLSTIARIFDPLGVVGPMISKCKIFMQRLWRLKIDWNDQLPEAERQEWHRFLTAFESVNNIDVDRCIVVVQAVYIEIHGFADASERCYGAVVYCKSTDQTGRSLVKLIASKSRVSPLKSLTIPRLELCAAVLLVKLTKKVVTALKLSVSQVYYWSDSMIVLSWIQKEPSDLKAFVQNRVAAIQELTSIPQWRHVATDQNPADLISRGVDPDKLTHQNLWWNGPVFLSDPPSDYPNRTIIVSDKREDFQAEFKVQENSVDSFPVDNSPVLNVTVNNFWYDLINLRDNYLSVLRIFSYVLRFVKNVRKVSEKKSGPLEPQENNEAENRLIKAIQHKEFAVEIKSLEQKRGIPPKSKLKTLNPFLDDDGVLRLGGRLDKSNLSFIRKHPAILPRNHVLTLSIIRHVHKKYFHVGTTGLLSFVREKFWPLGGRSVCRKIVHDCVICFKANPTVSSQLMGDLPRDRVVPDFPFNCSGVDFCGPFSIKYRNQRKGIFHKVYVCVFVCLVTKAVHIELVTDLTSDSFIATLKRFIARRGKCAKLYSDNAMTFVGANGEIKRLHELVRRPDEQLAGFLSSEGIVWKFIPPRSPNFGGLWEAKIKGFKSIFKRVASGCNLNYEEFLTITTQIEGILNSRPISPLSASVDDFQVLTPAHFLIGRQLNSLVEPDLTNIQENRLNKFQKTTKIVQLIWKKWHRNYLDQLQQRSKWHFVKNNVKIGDLVLLVEENLPTNQWVLGRIVNIKHGSDGNIRVVQVKTQSGIFLRGISKVCLLPCEN